MGLCPVCGLLRYVERGKIREHKGDDGSRCAGSRRVSMPVPKGDKK
jgi:hypothetical protein